MPELAEPTWMFEINASMPPDPDGRWRRNLTVHIVTTGVPRALELFAEAFPEGSVDKIERRNRTAKVIVDSYLLAP